MLRWIVCWLLAWGMWLPVVGQAQTYFNRRYAYAPDVCGATNGIPVANGYAVAGYGYQPNGDVQLYVQLLDATGRPTRAPYQESRLGWHTTTGRPGCLQAAPGGGFILAGYRFTPSNTGGAVGRLWRFSAQGDTLWSRTYQALAGDGLVFETISHLPDGGYALGGQYYQPTGFGNNYQADCLLLVTDSSGNERWRRTYQVLREDRIFHVLPTPDGGFLLSGYSRLQGLLESDVAVVKTDSTGRQEWSTTVGNLYYTDYAVGAFSRPGGGYLVAATIGSRDPLGTEMGQPALLWLDSAGRIERQRRYGPSYPQSGLTSFYAVPGGYVLGGQSNDTAGLPVGAVVFRGFGLKVCEDGDSVWYRTYRHYPGRYSHGFIYDFRPAPDGGFVGTGFANPSSPDTLSPQAMWVFKTDQYGYLQAGGAPPTVQCQVNGLGEELTIKKEELRVWPNPSADGHYTLNSLTPGPSPISLTPGLSPKGEGSARLVVTDALGRVVWRGAWDGAAETVVDLRRCAPGLYLLRLTGADGRSVARKLVRE